MDEITPPRLMDGGICSAREALYELAGEPLEEPEDPFKNTRKLGEIAGGSARWLLANRAAAQARAAHGDAGLPALTAGWRALQEREGFTTSARDTLWTEDEVFAIHVEGIDGYCQQHGISAAALVAEVDRHAPFAVAFLDRRDRRNRNVEGAGQRLLAAARRKQGLELYARDPNENWGVIERALLLHPSARWRHEPGALLYENRLCLTGDLEIAGLVYTHVTVAADDVLALGQPARARSDPAPPSTPREAVKVVVQALFPNGLPPNAKRRNEQIVAELKRRYEISACPSTIRAAIRELKAAGKLAP